MSRRKKNKRSGDAHVKLQKTFCWENNISEDFYTLMVIFLFMYVKDEDAECPTCGATVSIDATECPECGELFAEDIEEVVEEIDELKEEKEIDEVEELEEKIVPEKRTRSKTFFFMGIIIAIIGVGSALSSLLHDWLRIPFPPSCTAYDAIGWLNRLVIGIGLIILVVGIIFLILSLRAEKVIGEEE